MRERRYLSAGAPLLWALVALVSAVVVWVVWNPGHFPNSDAHSYDSSARHLLATGRLSETWAPYYKAWRPHGYTLFVSAVYWISGSVPSHVIGVQTLLFAGMVGMLVAACRIVARGPLAPHLCGLLLVTYVPFYHYVLVLLAEQLHFFLLAGAILSLACLQRSWQVPAAGRRRLLFAALTGLMFGLATLAKSFAFYFPLLVVVVLAVVFLVRRLRHRTVPWRPALVGLLAFIVAVAPFLVRNWIAIGTPTTLTSYGGYNLYMANYGLKFGNWRNPTSSIYYDAIDSQVNRIRRTSGDETKENSELTRRAVRIIRAHPKVFVKKMIWQARLTLTTAGRYGLGSQARATEAQYIALLLLAGLGAVLWVRRAPLLVLGLLAFVAYVVLIFSVTFTMNRLKEPLMPAVIVLATLGLAELRQVPALLRSARGSPA